MSGADLVNQIEQPARKQLFLAHLEMLGTVPHGTKNGLLIMNPEANGPYVFLGMDLTGFDAKIVKLQEDNHAAYALFELDGIEWNETKYWRAT